MVPGKGWNSRNFLLRRLVRDRIDPDEFKEACELLAPTSDWLSENLQVVVTRNSESPEKRLRAACALRILGQAAEPATESISQLVYEFASNDMDRGLPWVELAQAQFPMLSEQLHQLRNQVADRKSDLEVVDQLIVAVSKEPEDLIRQAVQSQRPLAGILPTLLQQFKRRAEVPSFPRMLSSVGGAKNIDDTSLASLWLALLYVADIDRDFAEIDTHLFRMEDATNRSAETSVVCRAFASGVSRSQWLELAERWHANDDQRLAAVLLALGDYPPPANIPPRTRELLTNIWTDTQHSYVHSACDWLMRKWQIEPDASHLPVEYDDEERNWRVSRDRMFVRIRRPARPFALGTRAEDLRYLDRDLRSPNFNGFEVAHPHQIAGDFEIAAREVTVAEFEAFLNDRADARYLDKVVSRIRENPTKLGTDEKRLLQMPADGLSWYNAVEFCIWLSQRHGLPSCYGELEDVNSAFESLERSKRVLPCDRSKTGYRLPTNGEWELACRAGTATRWPMGDTDEYLVKFAACSNSGGNMVPTATLRPNSLGLFDLLGNVAEMTDSPSHAISAGELFVEPAKRSADADTISFDLRGGAYYESSSYVRTARRVAAAIHQDGFGLGFRLVRSLPSDE